MNKSIWVLVMCWVSTMVFSEEETQPAPRCNESAAIGFVSGVIQDSGNSTIDALFDEEFCNGIMGIGFQDPLLVGEYVYYTVPAQYVSAAGTSDVELTIDLEGALENMVLGKRVTITRLVNTVFGKMARIDIKKKPLLSTCRGCPDFQWMVIVDWFDDDVRIETNKFYFPHDAHLSINYFRDFSAQPAVSGVSFNNLNVVLNGELTSLSPINHPLISRYEVGIIRTLSDIPAGDYIEFGMPNFDGVAEYW